MTLEDHYTTNEKKLATTIMKQINSIGKKRELLKMKIAILEGDQNHLEKRLRKIDNKVIDRMQKRCRHDVVGPYECARDDCSGGHYRCRKCGRAEFHDFRNEKK